MLPRICIDPGHNSSGADTGAEGFGLYEQDLTLDIGLKLFSLMASSNKFAVVMTRTGPQVPGVVNTLTDSLRIRCDIANNFKADLFLSIHINAEKGLGTEIIYISDEAGWYAERILPHLVDIGFNNRGLKIDNSLYVLKNTIMPAIITENGFIDNEIDAKRLKTSAFRQKIAEAHYQGLCDCFNIKGEDDMLKIAILKYSAEDEWAAKDIDAKLGGVANFTRQGTAKSIPVEAMSAQKLIVIGGPRTGHLNEVYLSGQNKYDTATEVNKFLKIN